MTPELLWTEFPQLWHMAEGGSWPSISERGLLSTSALLDMYGVNGENRATIETNRRRASIVISREGLPDAVIRDQKPMSDTALRNCLRDGLTPADWYRILNSRTFFWLSKTRLRKLLSAKAYRDRAHTVLTVDTRSLVESHLDRIELSPINSGSTIIKPVPRGNDTFKRIQDYDFDYWCERRPAAGAIVELIVKHSVPDIQNHVVAVHYVSNDSFEEIWRRPE